MDPLDPVVAHQIVIEYARNLERDVTEERLPARADSLPYAKPIIKTAISTSVRHLATTGQLTSELRDYLETAYTCLAEYLDGEIVDLITTYRRSGEDLAGEARPVRDRTLTQAWRTLSETSALAGEVARATAAEADALRSEFRSLIETS
jgi:hypothetical protein